MQEEGDDRGDGRPEIGQHKKQKTKKSRNEEVPQSETRQHEKQRTIDSTPIRIIEKCTHSETLKQFYFCRKCWQTYNTKAAELDDAGISYLPQKFAFCEHGRQKNYCKQCPDSYLCVHRLQKSKCEHCKKQDSGGVNICKHLKKKFYCRDCSKEYWKIVADCEARGHLAPVEKFKYCRHDKYRCTICPKSMTPKYCIHNIQKIFCRECRRGGLCEHSKIKYQCRACAKAHWDIVRECEKHGCPPPVKKFMYCRHDKQRCKECRALITATQKCSGTATGPDMKCCTLCNTTLQLEWFIHPESGEVMEICIDCHEMEKTILLDDETLPDFHDCMHCYQCDRDLPFSDFGPVPDFVTKDFTYCNECIEVLEHRPLFLCPWGCGKYVPMRDGGPVCDKCAQVDHGSAAASEEV